MLYIKEKIQTSVLSGTPSAPRNDKGSAFDAEPLSI